MNKVLLIIAYYLIFTFKYSLSFSQSTFFMDSIVDLVKQETDVSYKKNNFNASSGIICNPNKFWGADFDSIYQYSLNTSFVSFDSGLSIPSPDANLVFCNNLNGGSFSPTFYSSDTYFDGIGWVNAPGLTSTLNGGGNGNLLYFMNSPLGGLATEIYFYDGISSTLIYSTGNINIKITVADLAVDDNGFAYFFTGTAPITGALTDSLHIISSSGQMIDEFAFNYQTENAYGSFISNGIIYLGLGPGHPVYPNTLLPLTIVNNSIMVSSPLPFPTNHHCGDLAGCNAGFPLAVKDNLAFFEFSIFPNPTNGDFKIIFLLPPNKSGLFQIFDITGKVVFKYTLPPWSNEQSFKLPELADGIYNCVITSDRERVSKKIAVINE